MYTLTATNSHHFNKGIVLTLTSEHSDFRDSKLTLKENGVELRGESVHDIATLINSVFAFVGCSVDRACQGEVTYNPFIQVDSNTMTDLDLIRLIYSVELQRPVRFVNLNTCGCNMGYCDAVTGYHISNVCRTYGDALSKFAGIVEYQGHKYYYYPDSVILELEECTKLPEYIHSRDSCYSPKIKTNQDLDLNGAYISALYSR